MKAVTNREITFTCMGCGTQISPLVGWPIVLPSVYRDAGYRTYSESGASQMTDGDTTCSLVMGGAIEPYIAAVHGPGHVVGRHRPAPADIREAKMRMYLAGELDRSQVGADIVAEAERRRGPSSQ